MLRVVFRPAARFEAQDARAWYEKQAPGLGLEFTRSLDAVLSAILRFPQSFPVVEAPFRQAILRKFPYSIIYEINGDEMVVLRCFHHRRDPGIWRSATGK